MMVAVDQHPAPCGMGRRGTLADAGQALLRRFGVEQVREAINPLVVEDDAPAAAFNPNPGPQTEAIHTLADELYYGGSAGGGKSFLLCGLALTQHRNSLLLRRVSVDTKGLVDNLKLIATDASWKSVGYGGEMRTADGRVIEVGGCQYEDDWKKYAGRAHDLCVAADTLILMGGGEYRRVSDIRPGDMVATLHGPRPVTRAVRRGVRRCRAVYVGGVRTVVTDNHRMLTSDGWVAPLDLESKLSRAGGSTSSAWSRSCSTTSPLHAGRCPTRPTGEPHLQNPLCTARPEEFACSEGVRICSEVSGGERQDVPPLPRYYARLVLHAPDLPSDRPSSVPACRRREYGRARSGWLTPGSRTCCRDESGSYGEPTRRGLISARCDTPSPVGVVRTACSHDNTGGRPRTPEHSRRGLLRYSHPYTMADRVSSEPCRETWAEIGPAGDTEVVDLTVAECAHYISFGGIIHSNCGFDELPQFTERQYTTLIGWNRVANPVKYPHQRCRVVGAGNPPTDAAGEWVMRRWAAWLSPDHGNRARPGELRYYLTLDDKEHEFETAAPVEHKGKVYRPKSRTFIPARLEDNPALLATGYDATLEALPEPLRSMLRYGDFSTARIDDRWQLIPTAWVIAAQKRWVANQEKKLAPLSALGVDVAMSQGKGDNTVIAPRHGHRIERLIKRPGSQTPDGQSVLFLIVAALNGAAADVNVDATGIGKSAYDMTQTTSPPIPNVRAIMAGGGSDYRDELTPQLQFANLRSAMYWNLRTWLNPEGGPEETCLELPPDQELLADLTAPRYMYRSGKVFVEPKDDGKGGGIRARLGRSTDAGDAVALACWKVRPPTVAFG